MATKAVAQSAAPQFRRVYVWEFPVRLYHWVNALCVAAICVTGYLIGKPLAICRGRGKLFPVAGGAEPKDLQGIY